METGVLAWSLLAILVPTLFLIFVLSVRQAAVSLVRYFLVDGSPFDGAMLHEWPSVAVLVPAHNEEQVIAGCVEALLGLRYPANLIEIIVIDDRSTDRTADIANEYVQRNPARLSLVRRPQGAIPGKPAALQDALGRTDAEIIVVFDADYVPGPDLLKQLVDPFVDPEVGATMGRVIPYNVDANLLTRLIDLERRASYTVDQAVRDYWHALPQYGGTVGGIRRTALESIGGFRFDALAEDTDLTYQLFLNGWRVRYLDHARCYEEAPETWLARYKQVRRWAMGHNQCLFRYLVPVLAAKGQPLGARIDAAIVLFIFLIPFLSLISVPVWFLYALYFILPGYGFAYLVSIIFLIGFAGYAPLFQVVVAALRDQQLHCLRYLPLIFASSVISMVAATHGMIRFARSSFSGRLPRWDKTARFRQAKSNAP